MSISLEKIEPRLLAVLSEAIIVLLSLPDPPPPDVRNFRTLATIYQLAGTLGDAEAKASLQKAAAAALTRQLGTTR
jgi:hypothetical protein